MTIDIGAPRSDRHGVAAGWSRVPELVGCTVPDAADRALDAGYLIVPRSEPGPRAAPVWCQDPVPGTRHRVGDPVHVWTEGIDGTAGGASRPRLPTVPTELLELWIAGEAPPQAYVEGETHTTVGWSCVAVARLLRRLTAFPDPGYMLSADLWLSTDGHVVLNEKVDGDRLWSELLQPEESFALVRPALGNGTGIGVAGLLAARHRLPNNRSATLAGRRTHTRTWSSPHRR